MFRRSIVSGLALLGLLAVHDLSYRIVGGSHKSSLLEETGHSWYQSLPILAAFSFVLILFGSLGKGENAKVSLTSVLGLQLLSYNTLEIVERLVHGTALLPSISLLVVSTTLHLPISFLLLFIYNFTVTIFHSLLLKFNLLPVAHIKYIFSFQSFSFTHSFHISSSLSPRSPPKIS